MNDYGATDHHKASHAEDFLRAWRSPEFLILALVPTAVFFLVLVCWTWFFLTWYMFCGFLSFGLLVLGLLLVVAGLRRPVWRPTGFAFFPAVFFASLAGLFLYDTYAIFPLFYRNTATYRNVVPSESSAAVRDAGRIVFTQESFVEAKHAMNFVSESGTTFCAAPINDKNSLSRIEFWAAGVNCCDGPGRFDCDDVKDPQAKAGIVVFDNNGYFQQARHDFYMKARAKAESAFAIQSVAEPIFVRWVREDNLEYLAHEYNNQAYLLVLVLTMIYLLLSSAMSYFHFHNFREHTVRPFKHDYQEPRLVQEPGKSELRMRDRELKKTKQSGCGPCDPCGPKSACC